MPKENRAHEKSDGLYGFVISMRFATIIMALIAAGSIVGTLIKQGATENEYLSLYSETTYRIIKFFGLNDVYHSVWFLLLLVLFTINLTLCTTDRFRRFLKEKNPKELPNGKRLLAMGHSFVADMEKKDEVLKRIKEGYKVVAEGSEGIILEKGRLARYGIYIIHVSILLILAGSLVGLIGGFRGSLKLDKGEIKDHFAVRKENGKPMSMGFAIRCKDFQVSFYPNGSPKDYVTTVEIIKNGLIVLEKQIRVNNPLAYGGLNFYQASYGSSLSFTFNIGGEIVKTGQEQPIKRGDVVMMALRYVKDIHGRGPGVETAYVGHDGTTKTMWFLLNDKEMQNQKIGGVRIGLVRIDEAFFTVLEVARDPGVPIVWTGFALILFGLFITFFTGYSRLYAALTPEGIVVAGYGLKNKDRFLHHFKRLKEGLSNDGRS